MTISGPLFGALALGALVLAGTFFMGQKKNLRLARRLSQLLEEKLAPQDQEYTWLGGVMGFTGEYKVQGFKKVMVVYRLLPRQSILWLPFHFLTGDSDTVQALFYMKKPPRQELHLVREGLFNNPKIYNLASLQEKKARLGERKYRILYEEDPEPGKELAEFLGDHLSLVRHLAITKEKGVFYLELPLPPSRMEEGVSLLGRIVRDLPALERLI